MKIKLSKTQWEEMGKKAGWSRTGQTDRNIPPLKQNIEDIIPDWGTPDKMLEDLVRRLENVPYVWKASPDEIRDAFGPFIKDIYARLNARLTGMEVVENF